MPATAFIPLLVLWPASCGSHCGLLAAPGRIAEIIDIDIL
ncbi:hypothetical protein SF83666_a42670 (plasmid) [Sinorhizobium fredii CCBAU 83666]|nr:hypothetical protein SF83666_a42670 [Sinorhizobium fredii CCBAU 83666]